LLRAGAKSDAKIGKYYIYHLLNYAHMFKERMNKTEVAIIRLFPNEQMTVSQIADALDIDISWASKSISHLGEMGFLVTIKKSKKLYVNLKSSPLGTALSTLLIEEPAMNFNTLLGAPSLRILPLLISPGYSTKDISQRTGLSRRTIQTRIKRWRGMGLVILEEDKYMFSQRHPLVIDFVLEYSVHRNICHLKENFRDATVIWQDRDEYIISLDHSIEDDRYTVAAATNLAKRGYDILSRNYYYHYCPSRIEVGEAEALVQTVKFNLINPRPIRYIRQALKDNNVTRNCIRKYAKKYDIRKQVEEALK